MIVPCQQWKKSKEHPKTLEVGCWVLTVLLGSREPQSKAIELASFLMNLFPSLSCELAIFIQFSRRIASNNYFSFSQTFQVLVFGTGTIIVLPFKKMYYQMMFFWGESKLK